MEIYDITYGNMLLEEFLGGPGKFDTDWNDLMRVVVKIESMCFSVQVDKRITLIYDKNHHFSMAALTKIEACWRTCVYFVEWNNKQVKRDHSQLFR